MQTGSNLIHALATPNKRGGRTSLGASLSGRKENLRRRGNGIRPPCRLIIFQNISKEAPLLLPFLDDVGSSVNLSLGKKQPEFIFTKRAFRGASCVGIIVFFICVTHGIVVMVIGSKSYNALCFLTRSGKWEPPPHGATAFPSKGEGASCCHSG